MTIVYKKSMAVFDGAISVEDAEDLLQWVQKHPKGKGDFSECTHIHLANLQVLMAARMKVAVWPHDANLKIWLATTLTI